MNYQIKNILWSTDFSAESLTALNYASYLAKYFKASIKAVHVVPDFAPALYETRAMMVADLVKRQEDLQLKARARLEKIPGRRGTLSAHSYWAKGDVSSGENSDGQCNQSSSPAV